VARREAVYTPQQAFYAAACAFAETIGAQTRYLELFREGVDDPEAVDTLASRDPGFRISLAGLDDPAGYVGILAAGSGCRHVWAQIADQLPTPSVVVVPVRGTVE
jgi:hypothetical protein